MKIPKELSSNFFSLVKYSDGCWEWQGSLANGYGYFYANNKNFRAHRWSYEYFRGPLGELWCCHDCDNRKCVNPFHLFKGTRQDNIDDMVAKGRHWCTKLKVCKNGHEFTKENTIIKKRKDPNQSYRACRACRVINDAKHRQKNLMNRKCEG